MPTDSDIPDVTVVSDAESVGLPRQQTGRSYLILIYGELLGRRFEVSDEPLLVGRGSDASIQLEDDCISRRHCKIVPGADGVVLIDLDSTNGTYVNNTAVSARPLHDGDRIQIGRTIFKFLSGDNIEGAYHEEIYRLKTVDALTGANNKRSFLEELHREVHRFLRYGRPLSIVMLDIDRFKPVNDEYGHLAGDYVLSRIGELLAERTYAEEVLCRYGGEEFALLLPETDLADARRRAEAIRCDIEQERFVFDGVEIPVTVSAGVAQAWDGLQEPDDFVEAADMRLYESKRKGRNRVEPQ
ncbi:MAG: GGDEF domain-containing protein [Polyangia bacterium]